MDVELVCEVLERFWCDAGATCPAMVLTCNCAFRLLLCIRETSDEVSGTSERRRLLSKPKRVILISFWSLKIKIGQWRSLLVKIW